ncbi:MAG TPA: PEGA domain-containing protein [Candidatus Limnocylindrales bacterium]|nr:PEGA domain-containing protein [Candidatus Limnocylindrales bacterium]
MDFLDPKKKRANLKRLYIGYVLMAIVLAFGTFILVLAAYGYDIDRRTGGVIQNGLIIVDAHPISADILINQTRRGTTADRLVLPAGSYNVQLQRDGYRDWAHQVNLEGSSIEQLAYPFLFPKTLVTKTIQQYASVPPMASQSPDRHWLVVQSPTGLGVFNVIDLNNNKNPVVTINIPTSIITETEGQHAYETIEWSTDNAHLLLKHTYTGGQEFIVLDRSNAANSLNLSKLFPDQYNAISLRDKKPDQFYLFDAASGTLASADAQNKVVNPLLTRVISYKSYQADTIAYVSSTPTDTENTEFHLWQNGQDHLVRTLPAGPAYLMDMAQFNGHFYVASGSSKDGRVYIYKDPFGDLGRRPARTPQPVRVLVVPSAEYVSFSGIARFIAVQEGSHFAVYDIETDRQIRYNTKLPLAAHQKASWMDGHRLILVSQGSVTIFDFDGLNSQTLSASLTAFNPFFDRDYSAMFTLAPAANSPDKTALNRTELRVLPAGQQANQ